MHNICPKCQKSPCTVKCRTTQYSVKINSTDKEIKMKTAVKVEETVVKVVETVMENKSIQTKQLPTNKASDPASNLWTRGQKVSESSRVELDAKVTVSQKKTKIEEKPLPIPSPQTKPVKVTGHTVHDYGPKPPLPPPSNYGSKPTLPPPVQSAVVSLKEQSRNDKEEIEALRDRIEHLIYYLNDVSGALYNTANGLWVCDPYGIGIFVAQDLIPRPHSARFTELMESVKNDAEFPEGGICISMRFFTGHPFCELELALKNRKLFPFFGCIMSTFYVTWCYSEENTINYDTCNVIRDDLFDVICDDLFDEN